jgi:hypothetical protein
VIDRIEWFYGLQLPLAEVVPVTGVARDTVQNWSSRDLLPGLIGGGKGTPREYSARLISAIVFARDLIALGFETNLAISIGLKLHDEMLKAYRDIRKAGADPRELQTAFTQTIAIVSPDREGGRHKIGTEDWRKFDAKTLRHDAAVIFYPAGAAMAGAINEALKVKGPDTESGFR